MYVPQWQACAKVKTLILNLAASLLRLSINRLQEGSDRRSHPKSGPKLFRAVSRGSHCLFELPLHPASYYLEPALKVAHTLLLIGLAAWQGDQREIDKDMSLAGRLVAARHRLSQPEAGGNLEPALRPCRWKKRRKVPPPTCFQPARNALWTTHRV